MADSKRRLNTSLFWGLGLALAFLFLAGRSLIPTPTASLPKDLIIMHASNYNEFPEARLAVDAFIGKYFLTSGLIRTNLSDAPQVDLAAGEDLLSESVGLLLLYYIESDQEAAFEAQFKLAEYKLKKSNGLFQWRTREGQPIAVNASVDDLRIAKALLLASDLWQREDFKIKALELSQALLEHCVKNGKLLSYDSPNAPPAPAFYFDFKAMFMLTESHPQWEPLLADALQTFLETPAANGPFYDLSTANANDRSYKMTENALIVLHLAEIGQVRASDLDWYKTHLQKSAIVALYDTSGTAMSAIESPAIYGILAQIGKTAGDRTLYQLAAKKLQQMQIQAPGPYYGGFLSQDFTQGYSFDHLMALLGY